jgi:predicted nucleic acid-binding protein
MVDDEFDQSIWRVIDEFAGVPMSYADASLVVLARRLRVPRVFSFDSDLKLAGLDLVPE